MEDDKLNEATMIIRNNVKKAIFFSISVASKSCLFLSFHEISLSLEYFPNNPSILPNISIPVKSLEEDLEIMEKALECRKSDIEKAQDTGKEYFVKLIGDLQEAAKDLDSLQNALVKIKEYSD